MCSGVKDSLERAGFKPKYAVLFFGKLSALNCLLHIPEFSM